MCAVTIMQYCISKRRRKERERQIDIQTERVRETETEICKTWLAILFTSFIPMVKFEFNAQ
jgi:hypothetical protein